MTKRILITGGSGFIAKSLYEHLSNAYFSPLENNVVATTRRQLNLLDLDSVRSFLEQNKFDVVIHSATYDAVPRFTTKDPRLVLENNLRMFFNILDSKKHIGQLIYFGSGAEAGRENWIPQMTEEYIENHIPQDQYGFSKHIMNEIAIESDNVYNLRLFGVFGKFDDWRYRFISNACCKAVLGMPITINKNVRFDYLDIQDLCNITQKFIEQPPESKAFNVCTGKVHDYQQIAEKIRQISGKKIKIITKEPGLKPEYSGTNLKLMEQFKDLNITPIDKSIENLYNWYNSNKEIIKKDLFEY